MRWLINYIRSCFCKHDLKFEEEWCERKSDLGDRCGDKVSVTCKKCGYHKSYWKY